MCVVSLGFERVFLYVYIFHPRGGRVISRMYVFQLLAGVCGGMLLSCVSLW